VLDEPALASGLATGSDWWSKFERLCSLRLPDLAGKSVLDVGSGDGYFAFAAERLGAARVLAVESCAWRRPGGKDAFERTRQALASRVQSAELDVLDLRTEAVGKFDVVLLVGVLERSRDPRRALIASAGAARELLVVETCTRERAAAVRTLQGAGFPRVLAHPSKRFSAERLIRSIAGGGLVQARVVVHAGRVAAPAGQAAAHAGQATAHAGQTARQGPLDPRGGRFDREHRDAADDVPVEAVAP
jgi:SAM-dependent methyltransferase